MKHTNNDGSDSFRIPHSENVFYKISNTKLQNLSFIALDLETTGLDTSSCGIIEIAAIRFQLSFENGKFTAINQEERSMLIDPEIPLSNEISMITGISEAMLHGKSKWSDIENKVQDFIGEGIIVGHNVLFDIAVLTNHWLDLKENIILDTFELSEFLAQDQESLNLKFLAEKFGLAGSGEHRALDDTKMSLDIFCHFLDQIYTLSPREYSILEEVAKHDMSHLFSTILDIIWRTSEISYTLPYKEGTISTHNKSITPNTRPSKLIITSLRGTVDEEVTFLKNKEKEYWNIFLLAHGKKQIDWIRSEVEKVGLKSEFYLAKKNYISINQLKYQLDQEKSWERKYAILITKFLFWLEKTETGNLWELKYYGEEHNSIEEFRSRKYESHVLIDRAQEKLSQANIVIWEINDYSDEYRELWSWRTLMVRDVEKLEDSVRSIYTVSLDFSEIFSSIIPIWKHLDAKIKERLIFCFSYIERIFIGSVNRPSGPLENPPWDFWETYHLSQWKLWENGWEKILILIKSLQELWNSVDLWLSEEIKKELELQREKLQQWIRILYRLFFFEKINISVILSIAHWNTEIQIIPTNVREEIAWIFSHFSEKIYGYGCGIDGEIMESFLRNEIKEEFEYKPIEWTIKKKPLEVIISHNESKSLQKFIENREYTTHIILTTSLKHIRTIATDLRIDKWWDDTDIFIQWISWGKWKIISNFLRSKKKRILIGLIDTWRDEYDIWKVADMIYLMKVPFDPPTDIRFLARTVGMKNNFESYSMPIALIKINLLLSRIYSNGYSGKIICFDARLSETQWWKELQKEFI
jgi:DNA polymerase III epsilon subunit family exonuclease